MVKWCPSLKLEPGHSPAVTLACETPTECQGSVSMWSLSFTVLSSIDELLEYEEKKRQAEEEKQPLPELVRAKVPFSSCLEAYGAPEQVDDFWSTALQAKSVALK